MSTFTRFDQRKADARYEACMNTAMDDMDRLLCAQQYKRRTLQTKQAKNCGCSIGTKTSTSRYDPSQREIAGALGTLRQLRAHIGIDARLSRLSRMIDAYERAG